MILVKTRYKTHNNKFMSIIKIFKTLQYPLKDYKYKIFIFINNNDLCLFINIKNLSFSLFYWTQKFFITIFKLITIKSITMREKLIEI